MSNPQSDLLLSRLLELGWSQADLVRRLQEEGCHVTHQAVSQWCRGGGIADRRKVALCGVLGISVAELVAASVAIPASQAA